MHIANVVARPIPGGSAVVKAFRGFRKSPFVVGYLGALTVLLHQSYPTNVLLNQL